MQVVLRPIDSLTPYDHNPRLNDNAVAVVAESIVSGEWDAALSPERFAVAVP